MLAEARDRQRVFFCGSFCVWYDSVC